MSFVAAEAESYALRTAAFETPLMRKIRDRCEKEKLNVVAPQTGALLRVLGAAATLGREGTRILEVGTLYGYSALALLAGAAPDTRLKTIELDEQHAQVAEANFTEAGVAHRVSVHRGFAMQVLPLSKGPYDLVFLDAVKAEYPAYLEHALRVTRPGGLIVADNVLWSGRVWDARQKDPDTEGIRHFTKTITSSTRLTTAIIPVGDGVSVSVAHPHA